MLNILNGVLSKIKDAANRAREGAKNINVPDLGKISSDLANYITNNPEVGAAFLTAIYEVGMVPISGAPEADPFIRVFVNRLSQGAGVAYARAELFKIAKKVAALYRLWQNSQQQQYMPNVNPFSAPSPFSPTNQNYLLTGGPPPPNIDPFGALQPPPFYQPGHSSSSTSWPGAIHYNPQPVQPAVQPIIAQPAVQPIAQPAVQPIIAQPTVQPIAQPAVQPIAQPAAPPLQPVQQDDKFRFNIVRGVNENLLGSKGGITERMCIAAINAYNQANPHKPIILTGLNKRDFGQDVPMYLAQLRYNMEGKIIIIDTINNRVLFNK